MRLGGLLSRTRVKVAVVAVGALGALAVSVLPAHAVSLRGQVGELSGSMALAAVLALLATVLWGAVLHDANLHLLGSLFFTTVALSWAVLVPAKLWTLRPGDGWGRRLAMMGLGTLIGLGTMWLNGWTPAWPDLPVDGPIRSPGELVRRASRGLTVSAGYVAYFGLALGAMRWWRLADRRRRHWFSLFPVLASGFWALVLSFVWPWMEQPSIFGAAALVMASAGAEAAAAAVRVNGWPPRARGGRE